MLVNSQIRVFSKVHFRKHVITTIIMLYFFVTLWSLFFFNSSLDDPQKKKYISGTISRTKMADHFFETLEYKQCKNLGVAYLKVTKSVKKKKKKKT